MNFLKKMFILLLSVSVLFLQFPNAAFAKYYAMPNDSTKITKKAPQVLSTPDEDIPVDEKAAPLLIYSPSKKGGSKLLWYILGIAVVGGAAAAGGGGGGGGNGVDTGSFTGSW